MTDEGSKARPWSDDLMVMFLLYQLYIRQTNGDPECTVHQLSTLENIPVQRDQRIKRLMQMLCNRGLVTASEKNGFIKYSITQEGTDWW
jgi:hypothetical protein